MMTLTWPLMSLWKSCDDEPQGTLTTGKMFEGSHVRTTGKFAEKKWFLASTYIPYALGAAYILSGDLVKKIAQNSLSLMQYHNEDVSVSVWISHLMWSGNTTIEFVRLNHSLTTNVASLRLSSTLFQLRRWYYFKRLTREIRLNAS